jgi:hypothetical protein
MQQSKRVSRLLVGGILSLTLAVSFPWSLRREGAELAVRPEEVPPTAERQGQDLVAWAPRVPRQALARAQVLRPEGR